MNVLFKNDIKSKNIQIEEKFKIEDVLTSEVEVAIWNSQGLPNDELSI